MTYQLNNSFLPLIYSPFSLDFIHHQKSLMQFYFLNFANSINKKSYEFKR